VAIPAAQNGAVRGDNASVSVDASSRADLVGSTARLVDEALSLLENAKRADDRRTALAALREARDGLALLMRAGGFLAPENTVTIDARRQSLVLDDRSLAELLAMEARLPTVTDNRRLSAATQPDEVDQ
jgi:hypothetical protein